MLTEILQTATLAGLAFIVTVQHYRMTVLERKMEALKRVTPRYLWQPTIDHEDADYE